MNPTIKEGLLKVLDSVRDELRGGPVALTKMLAEPGNVEALGDLLALLYAHLDVQDNEEAPTDVVMQSPFFQSDKGMRVAFQGWLLMTRAEDSSFHVAAITPDEGMAAQFCMGNDQFYEDSEAELVRVINTNGQVKSQVRNFRTLVPINYALQQPKPVADPDAEPAQEEPGNG